MIKIKKIGLLFLMLTTLVACNKETELTKAISIQIVGYNIGNSELEVSIDELTYDKFRTPANKQLDFRKVYTYPSTKEKAVLTIKDVLSGKEMFLQNLPLNSAEKELFFPFVMINGNVLEIKPPTPDAATNKLGFYVHYPQSSDAIDIFLKNNEGQISYVAKNVLPSTWVYADYLTSELFKDNSKSYTLYFTKAGTTDVWAFNDSEQMSKSPAGGSVLFPKFGDKGLIRTYFVTPGNNQLDVVSLFKR